jgi:hypothetical protein
VLFDYVYSDARQLVPAWVRRELTARLDTWEPSGDRICRGTLLSRSQYLVDLEQWGYRDARLLPRGTMTAEQIAVWTAAAFEGSPCGCVRSHDPV